METAETAARYRTFARAEARGRSPLYVQLAGGVAEDPELLGLLGQLPPPKRQVLGLEEDDVTPAARKRISERIQTLEDQLTATQQSLDKLRSQEPSAPPDLATAIPLLEALPLRGDQLRSLEPVELREMMDSLDLKVVYDHPHHSAQIGVVLVSGGSGVRGSDLCPR